MGYQNNGSTIYFEVILVQIDIANLSLPLDPIHNTVVLSGEILAEQSILKQ